MNALNFRALLVDPGNKTQERPLQTFHPSVEVAKAWANTVLAAAASDGAFVMIYQTVETKIETVRKPAKEVKA